MEPSDIFLEALRIVADSWQITMVFAEFCGAIMIYRSVSRQTRNSLELSKINTDMQIELARISKLQAPAIEHKPTNKQHEGM
jgi:hypothetical protein